MVVRDRGPMAGRHIECIARAGWHPRRSPPGASRHVAALSEDRRAVAAFAVGAWAGRVPGRRHGAGQDHPGAVAAVGAATAEQRRATAAVPAGGAGLAAGQLGHGDRAVRPRPEGADRAPFGDDGRCNEAVHASRGGRTRPRDHQLWHAAAHAGSVRARLAAGDPRPGNKRSRTRMPSRPGPPRR